jgi:hypothetical protein
MHPMLNVLILDAHRAAFERRTRPSRSESALRGLPRLRDRTRVRG